MVKVMLVGAGGIARKHSECLRENPKATIVGVLDRNREAAKRLAAKLDARVFDDFDECPSLVDVVYVLTPPSFHREYSVRAMEAGKHVLCEKPLATNLEDARAMSEAARQNGVKLMTAFNHRFRKGFRRLKEVVDSGCLGEIISYWCQRIGSGTPRPGNWRATPGLLCGMAVESLSHDIDMLRWIAGDVISVSATVYESVPAYPGFDDNATAVMTLACGGSAVIHASWSSRLGRNSRGVIGTNGTAYLEGPGLWTLKTLRWKTDDTDDETTEELDDKDFSYAAENDHFLDCVANDRELLVTGDDGLAALKVSLAMLESQGNQIAVSS